MTTEQTLAAMQFMYGLDIFAAICYVAWYIAEIGKPKGDDSDRGKRK